MYFLGSQVTEGSLSDLSLETELGNMTIIFDSNFKFQLKRKLELLNKVTSFHFQEAGDVLIIIA